MLAAGAWAREVTWGDLMWMTIYIWAFQLIASPFLLSAAFGTQENTTNAPPVHPGMPGKYSGPFPLSATLTVQVSDADPAVIASD